MERFQPLTIITKHSILDVAAVLYPPLVMEKLRLALDWKNNIVKTIILITVIILKLPSLLNILSSWRLIIITDVYSVFKTNEQKMIYFCLLFEIVWKMLEVKNWWAFFDNFVAKINFQILFVIHSIWPTLGVNRSKFTKKTFQNQEQQGADRHQGVAAFHVTKQEKDPKQACLVKYLLTFKLPQEYLNSKRCFLWYCLME